MVVPHLLAMMRRCKGQPRPQFFAPSSSVALIGIPLRWSSLTLEGDVDEAVAVLHPTAIGVGKMRNERQRKSKGQTSQMQQSRGWRGRVHHPCWVRMVLRH